MNQAMQNTTFSHILKSKREFDGTVVLDSVKLQRLGASEGNVRLYGTLRVKYTPEKAPAFIRSWNAAIRLTSRDGGWKIRFLSVHE